MKSAYQAGADEVIIALDACCIDPRIIHNARRRGTRTVVSKGHGGIAWARNEAIEAARHELILPLDADDELLPGAVFHLYEVGSQGAAVYGDYVVNDALVRNASPAMIYRKSVCHATVLFSKADWQRVGGYKPEFNVGCEDHEFLLSLVEAGVKLIHIDAPVYRKTVSPDGRGARCLERRPLIASLLREFHPKVQL